MQFRRLLIVNSETKAVLTISTRAPESCEGWTIQALDSNGYTLAEIADEPQPRHEILSTAAHHEAKGSTGIKTLLALEEYDANHPAHLDPSKIVLDFGDLARLCRIIFPEGAPTKC